MTFGASEWGAADDVAESIFDAYVEAGGNFIDVADVYADGRSEEIVGGYIAGRGLRDRLVVATKYSFNGEDGNPLAGGNGRKNLHRALHGSLRRLRTDYVDMYWLHAWDRITPVDEVLQSLGDLVRAGKIRYFGFSDVPAWYAARAATLSQAHAVPGPIAMQLEYSLTERTIEREHVPAALELGLGITPWSPLGAGFLTGKYSRDAHGHPKIGGGRLDLHGSPFAKFTDRNWKTLDVLREVSREIGRPMAQVALAWLSRRAAVCSLLIGASKLEQLRDNLASLEITLPPELAERLDAVSALDPAHPYNVFSDGVNRSIFGGASVRR